MCRRCGILVGTCIYIAYIIITEIKVIFKFLWSDGDTTNHIVPLYSCNKKITLKMAAIATEIF